MDGQDNRSRSEKAVVSLQNKDNYIYIYIFVCLFFLKIHDRKERSIVGYLGV